MKNEKLLTVLIIVALILSIVSTVVSIMSLRRIKMHDDLLQAMQVLVYTSKLAEDIVPEHVFTVEPETAANEAQGQEQQADAQKTNAQQADTQKPAHKHPKKTHHSDETPPNSSRNNHPCRWDSRSRQVSGVQRG